MFATGAMLLSLYGCPPHPTKPSTFRVNNESTVPLTVKFYNLDDSIRAATLGGLSGFVGAGPHTMSVIEIPEGRTTARITVNDILSQVVSAGNIITLNQGDLKSFRVVNSTGSPLIIHFFDATDMGCLGTTIGVPDLSAPVGTNIFPIPLGRITVRVKVNSESVCDFLGSGGTIRRPLLPQ